MKLHFGDEQFEVDAAQLPVAFAQVTLRGRSIKRHDQQQMINVERCGGVSSGWRTTTERVTWCACGEAVSTVTPFLKMLALSSIRKLIASSPSHFLFPVGLWPLITQQEGEPPPQVNFPSDREEGGRSQKMYVV